MRFRVYSVGDSRVDRAFRRSQECLNGSCSHLAVVRVRPTAVLYLFRFSARVIDTGLAVERKSLGPNPYVKLLLSCSRSTRVCKKRKIIIINIRCPWTRVAFVVYQYTGVECRYSYAGRRHRVYTKIISRMSVRSHSALARLKREHNGNR